MNESLSKISATHMLINGQYNIFIILQTLETENKQKIRITLGLFTQDPIQTAHKYMKSNSIV